MWRKQSSAMVLGVGVVIACLLGLGGIMLFTTSNEARYDSYGAQVAQIQSTNAAVDIAIAATTAAKNSGYSDVDQNLESTGGGSSTGGSGGDAPQFQQPQKRIVIKNAKLDITVKETTQVITSIANTADTLGGWVVTSNSYESSSGKDTKLVYGSITIRIPADKLNSVLEQIKAMAVSVNNQTVDGQDVTQQYADLSSRLKNLEAAEEQLRSIMTNAAKTEDVLAVYRELVNTRGEIEQIKGQLQYFDESAAFSSIAVTINPYQETRPIEIAGWNASNSVNRAIEQLAHVLQGLADLIIWLGIVVLPFAIPLAIIGLIYWRFFRRKRPVTVQVTEPPSES